MHNPNRARRRFTPQQKEEAVALCLAEGLTCTAVAQRLGIPVSSLAKWVRQARIDRGELASAGQAATERLLEQLQPQLVTGGLSTSVVQLPEGQDADCLLREQGPATFEGLIAPARHWLEWRLDRLLAPLAAGSASPSLETLQAVEQAGQALIEQLPDGVLRRSAEQRLNMALQQQVNRSSSTQAKAQSTAALIEPCVSTARQRAEHRALRLFIHAPQYRELLQCLELQAPACRIALEWLSNLVPLAVDGTIAALALKLVPQLPGAVGAALAQAADPGSEVIAALEQQAEAELQMLLDLLEPL